MNSSSGVRSYRDLVAWQRGRELVQVTYSLTSRFPAEEKFGLVSQMRRAAVSVVSNIAEGYGRGSQVDYTRFLRLARGSLFELETQSLVALDLQMINEHEQERMQSSIDGCAKPLSGLIRKLSDPTAH